MYTLGISCYYHDSAAALLKDGHVIAAVEEERFSRKKFDDDFPKLAINWCLKEAGITYKIQPIKSSESSSNIVRPRSSILRSNYSFDLPSWEDAVKRYLLNNKF